MPLERRLIRSTYTMAENTLDLHFCLKCNTLISGLDQYVQHFRFLCSSATPMAPVNDTSKSSSHNARNTNVKNHLETPTDELLPAQNSKTSQAGSEDTRQNCQVNLNEETEALQQAYTPKMTTFSKDYRVPPQGEVAVNAEISRSPHENNSECPSAKHKVENSQEAEQHSYNEYLPPSVFDFLSCLELKARKPTQSTPEPSSQLSELTHVSGHAYGCATSTKPQNKPMGTSCSWSESDFPQYTLHVIDTITKDFSLLDGVVHEEVVASTERLTFEEVVEESANHSFFNSLKNTIEEPSCSTNGDYLITTANSEFQNQTQRQTKNEETMNTQEEDFEEKFKNVKIANILQRVQSEKLLSPPLCHRRWPRGGKFRPGLNAKEQGKNNNNRAILKKKSPRKRKNKRIFSKAKRKANLTTSSGQKLSTNNDKQMSLHEHMTSRQTAVTEHEILPPDERKCDTADPCQEEVVPVSLHCSPCRKTFFSQYVLARHLSTRYHQSRLVATQLSAECSTCQMKFASKYKLVRHLRSKHHIKKQQQSSKTQEIDAETEELLAKKRPFQCRPCEFSCSSADVFEQHLKDIFHTGRGEFTSGSAACANCQTCFSDALKLLRHFKEIPCSVSRPFVVKIIDKDKVCDVCCQTLATTAALKHHMQTEHSNIKSTRDSEGNLLCPYCGTRWRCQSVLDLHIRRKHTEVKPFQCVPCQRRFTDKNSLKRHLSTRKHIKTATLLSCKESISDLSMQIEISNQWEFYCDTCNYGTHYKSHYTKHTKSHVHRIKTGLASCRLSGNTVNSEDLAQPPVLQNHIPLICTYCKATKHNHEELVEHIRTHFPSQNAQCGSCFKTYSNKTLLQDHIVTKHPELVRSVPGLLGCELCSFKTRLKHRLLRHKYTAHNKSLPFLCSRPTCGKSFAFKSLLELHIRRTHKSGSSTNDTRAAQHQKSASHQDILSLSKRRKRFYLSNNSQEGCDSQNITSAIQGQPTSVTSHTQDSPFSHSVTGQQYMGQRYRCEFCTYKTTSSMSLKRHLRVHAGSKPFRCPYCTFASCTIESIRKHITGGASHPGKSLYPCTSCSSGFNQQKKLLAHLRQTHGQTDVPPHRVSLAALHPGMFEKREDFTEVGEGDMVVPVQEKFANRRKNT